MEDNILNSLKHKERELHEILVKTTPYKQWHAMKTAISVFEGKEGNVEIENSLAEETPKIEYDSNFTWIEKVYYALDNIKSGFVADIVKEILKVDNSNTEDFLIKRIGATISLMLSKGNLQVIHKSGRRIKVSRK